MTMTAEAIYEDGVLRLLTPVPYANGRPSRWRGMWTPPTC